VKGSNRTLVAALATAAATLGIVTGGAALADGPTLKLKASVIGASAPTAALTIELLRWSTDVERAPLLTALGAASPQPSNAAAAAPAGRAGRAGRGGRAAAPPASPLERLTTAIKAAPTLGFIWSDGPTGYSIKYAWRSASPGTPERIVLVTDRRLGANATTWPPASAEAANAEFTVVEMRIDGNGAGEAKSSLTSPVVVDKTANTLALDKYMEAPVLLKVTR
jgi:hypothetical protein